MSTLERAIAIAVEAHAGQIDKAGVPYILHPLRVMLALETNDERIVAVLHDVVEDTPWTLNMLREEGFSEDVIAGIDAVSRREEESYNEFIDRAACNRIGRAVKVADLLDNSDLSRIQNPTPADTSRQAKYSRALARLA